MLALNARGADNDDVMVRAFEIRDLRAIVRVAVRKVAMTITNVNIYIAHRKRRQQYISMQPLNWFRNLCPHQAIEMTLIGIRMD